jgi:DNA polymerase-1
MAQVDIAKAAEYAAEDAQVAFSLSRVVEEQLKTEKLWDLYWELERPLIRVLADMQSAGIRVDTEELARQSADVTRRLSGIVEDIYKEAGTEFNIDSPLQLRKVLFDQLKLPVLKRTKTGPSTDQDVLERLALQHSLPAKIIEQRQLSKLKGTYLDALPKLVNPRTGRIHCSFNQVVAATGRLSASDPNLQNIPIRTGRGGACAARSSRLPTAGNCCVPTTRRSSCGCWPTSAATRPCKKLFDRGPTSIRPSRKRSSASQNQTSRRTCVGSPRP